MLQFRRPCAYRVCHASEAEPQWPPVTRALPLVILICWATTSARAAAIRCRAGGNISAAVFVPARYAETFATASDDARLGFAARDDDHLHRHDGLDLRRAYLRMLIEPEPWVQAKTVLNFAELEHGDPEDVVRQAYVQLDTVPGRVELAVGCSSCRTRS